MVNTQIQSQRIVPRSKRLENITKGFFMKSPTLRTQDNWQIWCKKGWSIRKNTDYTSMSFSENESGSACFGIVKMR